MVSKIIIWKDIKGWEDFYEVNNKGEVRRKRDGYYIKGDINSTGYYRVCLMSAKHNPSKQRFFRHRLVAEHFIDNPNEYKEVNHKDHDLSNNSVENLEWCTRRYNEIDSHKNGNKPYKPFRVLFNNGEEEIFDSKPLLAEKLNVTRTLIKYWLNGKIKSYPKYGIKEINYI